MKHILSNTRKGAPWLGLLMLAAIGGVTAFQLYWLKQSYNREESALRIKTNAAFQQTVMELQSAKLNLADLENIEWNSAKKGKDTSVKIFVSAPADSMKIKIRPRREMVSTINIIKQKLKDSIISGKTGNVVIRINDAMVSSGGSKPFQPPIHAPGMDAGGHVFRLLAGVDSLQDSLRIKEVDSAYAIRLKNDGMPVSFSINRIDSIGEEFVPAPNQVVVGFANPSVYEMSLTQKVSYLLRQIAQPILFSVLLLGLTILSFSLLYRNMQKQKRLAEQKNEFISNITHELKTPIATVGVAIEALKNFNAIDNPQRTREYLDISQNELQRLNLLVDKVLKLSMFENKELDLKREPVDMAQVVNEVAESLKLQFDKKGAVLTVHTSGNTSLQGDRLHLVSVVFNLLDNALKYGSENPNVLVDTVGDENNVVLSVTDNGIGIPEEYREKVFEKFFRVPHGDTHNAKGYGLGLSYVAQVIQKHKGHIQVKSEAGKGTIFTITLPKNEV